MCFGGDDYITKPFNPLEVVARINAQLRLQSFYKKENTVYIELQAKKIKWYYFNKIPLYLYITLIYHLTCDRKKYKGVFIRLN
jgi:response regulator RpfG family c-di-GMP phosphodiesterase